MTKRLKNSIIIHIKKCKIKISNKIENIDFVQCKICNFHGKKISGHLNKVHNVEIKDYIKKYNSPVISQNSKELYSKANILNNADGNWIVKAKNSGIDLTEHHAAVGRKISQIILNSDEQKLVRSKNMIKQNAKQIGDPAYHKMLSEVAQRTSARQDVQDARSLQLKNWRDNNPEDFHRQCVTPLTTTFHSNPEKKMLEIMKSFIDFNFKLNKFVKDEEIFSSQTHTKQIDMADVDKHIYIEYDGQLHFKPFKGQETFDNIKKRDEQLDRFIIKNNYTLIRVGYDQYVDKHKFEKSFIKPECILKIKEILDNGIPGIYKIGTVYE